MKRIFIYIKPFFALFIFAVCIKGLGAVTDILIPFFMGKVIDDGIVVQDRSRIIFYCAMMLVFTILTVVFNLVANYLSAKATQRMGEKMRNHLYGHIQKLRVQDIDDLSTASLITRTTNDVERVQNTLLMMCRVIVRAPIMAVGGMLLSLMIDPALTGVIFVGMLLVGLTSYIVYRFTHPIFRRVQQCLDKLTLILRESLAGIRVIKSFNKGGYETNRFDQQVKAVRDNEMAAGKIHTVSGPAITLINGLTTAGVLFFSMYRMRDTDIAVGEIITIVNYVTQILMAMSALPRIFMLFSRANTSAGRIGEILDITPESTSGTAENGKAGEPVLEFKNVSFQYAHGSEMALKNISFHIDPGQTIGVIGGTGSGKSTLMYLILRLYQPDSGCICLNGNPLDEYSNAYLHKEVTAALQQYNIFAMTVSENIALNMEQDERALSRAADIAQLSDVIEGLNDGFRYEISQTGTNLSGGQKQRVNIARALYRRASLTVLDDVSSALDYQTDLKLRNALKKEHDGRSVLLISQRVSSIRNADRILVLDNGEMVGFDTHAALLESCDVYQALCRTQGVRLLHEKEVTRNAGQ